MDDGVAPWFHLRAAIIIAFEITMAEYRVREARTGDRAAIGALWRELMDHHRALDSRFSLAPDAEKLYVRHALDMIRTRDALVLVADLGPETLPIGFLVGELQNRPPLAMPGLYGFISDAFVCEEWRGKGVGRALYGVVRAWFVTRKATSIELFVAETNPTAQEFWAAMGLEPFLKLLHEDL
jgi:GNAT superfamily N-acetyltransferase